MSLKPGQVRMSARAWPRLSFIVLPAAGQSVASPAPLTGIRVIGALSDHGPAQKRVVSFNSPRVSAGERVVADTGPAVRAVVRVEVSPALAKLAYVGVVSLGLLDDLSGPRVIDARPKNLGGGRLSLDEKGGQSDRTCH